MDNFSPSDYGYSKSDLKASNGTWRTQSLFWEHRHPEIPPIFTIKDENHTVDGIVYPSLKKIYMSYDHLPGYEYEFATQVLGGWYHWQTIQNNKLFKKMIEMWKEEKEVQLQAMGVKAMMHSAMFEGSKGANAAKWLAEKGWQPPQRGRPSKEELNKRAKEQQAILDELDADSTRLGLTLVKG